MLKKFTLNQNSLPIPSIKKILLLVGFIIMGITTNAQIDINCLYPFVPTDCSPCIDPSANMVDVTSDCEEGYTLTIGDPVLISGAGNCPGSTYTVTYTANDNCGSSASCSQTWVIQNEGPAIECPNDLYLTCGDSNNDIYIDYWLNSVQAKTSCGLLGLNQFNTYNANWINGPCPSGFQTVTFFATDDCGRTATCTATVFVLDHDEPVLVQEAEDLLEVCSYNTMDDFQNWINNHGGAIAEDACSNVSWSTIPANPQLPLACDRVEVTFVATDGCGWQVSTSAAFELIDCHPPVITGQPNDIMVECTDDIAAALDNWLNSNGGAMAEDACGNVNWMSNPMDPILSDDCGNTGSVTVVFIAKDDCGNEALTNAATFSVVDNTAPVFTAVPEDATVECLDDVNHGMPTVEDACGMVTLSSEDMVTNTVEGGFNGDQEVPPSNSDGSGTARGTYKASTGKLNLEVDFEGLGGNTVAAHIHNGAEGSNGGVVFVLPIPTGVTSGSFMFMADLDADQAAELEAGNYYINIHTEAVPSGEIRAQLFVKTCIGTSMRTWTATDECGNVATASQTITFEDTEAPVPSEMPADITISCGDPIEFSDAPTWTDNCDTDIFTSVEDLTENASCPNIAIYVRSWSAIDDCGNLGTTKQRIFVQDNEAPIFTYVPPVPDIDCMVPPFDFDVPIAEDNCGGPVTLTFVDEEPNGSICDEGAAYVRAYTATDECGNSSTVDVVIWVNADAGGPEFTFVPEDLTFYCADGEPNIPDAIAVDDCDPDVTITFEDEFNTDPSDCGNDYGYDIIRTWTATDHCGNQTTAVTLAWVKGSLSTPPGGFDNNNGLIDGEKQGRGFEEEIFRISPNPVNNQLNITFGALTEQEANIRVFNILGKEVLKQQVPAGQGLNTSSLAVDHLVKGTYLVSIEMDGQLMTRKFVKH